MNSFGILDFALPFGALALALLGWVGIRWFSDRRAPRIASGEGDAQARTRGGEERAGLKGRI